MMKKLLTGKAIATLGAVTLVSAGAAAAATGTLPSPFASDRAQQITAARVPDRAVISVAKHATDDAPADPTDATEATEMTAATEAPEATEAAAKDTEAAASKPNAGQSDSDTDTDTGVDGETAGGNGPDATGPARFGLCTAFAAHAEHGDAGTPGAAPTDSTDVPVPFQNLADAAAAAGQTVEEYCADVTPGQSASTHGPGDDSPSATAPGQTGDNPSATAPGQSGDNPSATAPGHTNDPSAGAPAGGSDDNPSATAPGQADNPSVTAPAGGSDDNPSATSPGHTGEHGSGHGDKP